MLHVDSVAKDKRVGVACEGCRKRKKKCDGLRPSCTLCISLERDCQYSGNVETRKRKQWDIEYVSNLEDQVATLRAYIESAELGQPQLRLISKDPRALESQPILAGGNTIGHDDASRAIPDRRSYHSLGLEGEANEALSSSAIADLSAMVWKMHIDNLGESTFTGPSGNFCFPSPPSRTVADTESLKRRLPSSTASLSPYSYDFETKQTLLDLFLVHLNPFHQFIPPSFQLLPGSYPFEDTGLNIIHEAVFAAGAVFSNTTTLQEAGNTFASHADEIAVISCRHRPSTMVVQALSILAWREFSLESNNCGWTYLSMAGGLASGLGLHVSGLQALSDSSNSFPPYEKITRIRTFWAFFLMDRIATSMLGRNCIIPWRRVDVPSLDTILNENSSLEELAFNHQCKLWHIHDQFMDQIYAFDFSALQFLHRNRLLLSARAALFAYKQSIPAVLQIAISTSSNALIKPPQAALFLNMSYQMSLLLIHRPYVRESPGSSSFNLALATMNMAASRMTHCIHLFNKHYLQNSSLGHSNSAPPFIVHHILTAAIMHLIAGTTSEQSRKIMSRRKLQICMQVLSALQNMWASAGKAIAQIQSLAVRWRVVGVLPLAWSFTGSVPKDEEGTKSISPEGRYPFGSIEEYGKRKDTENGQESRLFPTSTEPDCGYQHSMGSGARSRDSNTPGPASLSLYPPADSTKFESFGGFGTSALDDAWVDELSGRDDQNFCLNIDGSVLQDMYGFDGVGRSF